MLQEILPVVFLVTLTPSVDTAPMAGKVKTDRTITFQVLVDATPQEVFEMWTTETGANQFFGTDSRIDPKTGGLYEIDFGLRPDGEVAGPRGTKILRFEPPNLLWFEWASPFFADELNTDPKPTWVEMRFEEFSQNPPMTLLHFDHYGFGEGTLWTRVYSFFERGWFDILYQLKRHFETANGSVSTSP